MVKVNPTFLEENGKRKFVVLTMSDFAAIQEALEDAEDARILDEARRKGIGKTRITHKQILKEFGLSHLSRDGSRTGSNRRRSRSPK